MSSENIQYPKLIDIDSSTKKKDIYFIILIIFFLFLFSFGAFSSSELIVNAKFIRSENIREFFAPFNGYIKILSSVNGVVNVVFLGDNIKEKKVEVRQYQKKLSLLLLKKNIFYEERIERINNNKYKISNMEKNKNLLREKISILNSLLKSSNNSIKKYKKVLGVAISESDFQSRNTKKEKMEVDLLTYKQNLDNIENNIKEIKNDHLSDLREKISNVNLDIQDIKSKIEFLNIQINGIKITIKNNIYNFGRKRIRDNTYFEKGEKIFYSKENAKKSRIVAEINKDNFYQIDNATCAEIIFPIGYHLKNKNNSIICSFRKISQIIYNDKKKEYYSEFYLESLLPEKSFRGLLDGTKIKLKFRSKNFIKGKLLENI